MFGAVVGDLRGRPFEGGLQIMRGCQVARVPIIFLTERGTERQRITAVPSVIDGRVDDAAHAREPGFAHREFAFFRGSAAVPGADKVRQIPADGGRTLMTEFAALVAFLK